MILWRPVGFKELALLFDAQMREFPPRLPEQPIFYPVTNRAYAEQIARDWNTKEDDRAGYVTEFEIPDAYAAQFERHVVGGHEHEELWVPAERLSEFNARIRAPIRVVAAYFGDGFGGFVPEQCGLRGKSATEQFTCLTEWLPYSSIDVSCETAANAKAVFLNFPFWRRGCSAGGRPLTAAEQKVIDFIHWRWPLLNCGFDLPTSEPNGA
ncbi:MAG: hypothetical protein ABJF10_23925 [Chthoniobacter sp.]|uniref:hypothetical protein n=1 Tax=Chthoniobacter sp. TaxID=2510640 RepID=UPI0032A8C5F7